MRKLVKSGSILSAAFLSVVGCASAGISADAPAITGPVGPLPQAAAPRQPVRTRAPVGLSVEQRLLAAHNRYRVEAGVPPLIWDPLLAAGAAAYGPLLAGHRGELIHSPRIGRPNAGENLWLGTAGAFTPEAMVAAWGEERRDFRDGTFPNVSTTGNWLDVSHYTQMIWRGTTHVGCAIHRDNRFDYLVCRYSPRGNRDGQRVR